MRWVWRRFHGASRVHAYRADDRGFATTAGACHWAQIYPPIPLVPKDAIRPVCAGCVSVAGPRS